jgi:hypothetical protein
MLFMFTNHLNQHHFASFQPSSLPAFQPKLGKTSALLSCQAARELTELQALQDPGAGEEWKTAARTIQLIRQNIIF